MNALINISKRGAMFFKACIFMMLGISQLAFAQSNSIESVVANQQGSNIVVKVGLKNPITKLPAGFSIANPARIALDFADASNGTGKTTVDVNIGDLRTVTLVEASGRSRMIFNLNKPLNYATVIEGRLTGAGRPSSTLRALILRQWAANGRLNSCREIISRFPSEQTARKKPNGCSANFPQTDKW